MGEPASVYPYTRASNGLTACFPPDAEYDITVDGPELAAHAIRAGLVDEFQIIVCPVVVGSGKRFFPDGVRLDLELVEERRLRKGVVVLRYCVPQKPPTAHAAPCSNQYS